MSSSLGAVERSLLEKVVQRARGWIEGDLVEKLQGSFGIDADGRIEDVNHLSLSNAQASIRSDLVEIVEFLRSEGLDSEQSVARLVREAAFTHTNRLIAVRVAEAVGILPETMAKGIASTGFRDFSELAPVVASTEWGRFAVFVRLCADELAVDVPTLFDPRNPLLELSISETVLSKVVEAMSDLTDDGWAAPDALGWTYQFFNSDDERREMRKESSAPRDTRELAVRNQFFTPSYVVEFLVQNGLGARLAAGIPGLAEELPLLTEAPREQIAVDLDAVSVLDPACGSGHFLLGAYDVLERAWQAIGVPPSASAPAIVKSLWGIDVDPRATQIAQAAVMFRARRHCRGARLPKVKVICARALPTGPEVDAFIAALPEHVGRAVRVIADELVQAPVLGPLLKIEERLSLEVRDVFGIGVVEGTLSQNDAAQAGEIEAAVLGALASIADSATSTASQRIFAAEARDAVLFVEAMSQQYTAVLMNPPFGEPVPSTRDYLKAEYPLGWTELYAAFIERFLNHNCESIGVVSSSEYFRTKRLRGLRKTLATDSRMAALYIVRLGGGVLQGASVDASATVIGRKYEPGQTAAFARPTISERANPNQWAWRRVDLESFMDIPGSPYPFEASDQVLALFDRQSRLDPDIAAVRKGGSTFDNFRFLRLWWELPIGTSVPYPSQGWNPCARGGPHTPYLRSADIRIDMRTAGESLVEAAGRKYRPQIFQSSSWWGTACLGVPRQGTDAAFSLIPPGYVLSEETISVFPNRNSDTALLLIALNSDVVPRILEAFAKVRKNEAGYIRNLPLDLEPARSAELAFQAAADRCLAEAFVRESRRETSAWFSSPFAAVDAPGVGEFSDDVGTGVRMAFGLEGTGSVAFNSTELETVDEHGLVSYLVGVAFGRWDIREASARILPPTVMEFMDGGEPQFPPGHLREGNSEDNPALPAASGVLPDDPSSERDLSRTLAVLNRYLTSEGVITTDVWSDAFPDGDCRRYLRTRFFDVHESRYSVSQRRAPIYWQLQVPSKAWGLWLYAPKLSREMLFAVVRETELRQRLAEQQIGHFQREAETGSGGRKASEVAKELEAEQKLAVELASFRAEAERIANLGWEPDLDDGMVLNAAPLADLFPAWKDAAAYRKELRAGKYEWATVARYADQL